MIKKAERKTARNTIKTLGTDGDTASDSSSDVWKLRLYVAGQTAKSLTAFANLKRICEEHLPGKYDIEIVDLMKDPKLAKGDR